MSQGSGGSSGARTESWKMLKQVNVPTVQAVPDSKPMYFTTKATGKKSFEFLKKPKIDFSYLYWKGQCCLQGLQAEAW